MQLTIKVYTRRFILLKLTTDRREASRGGDITQLNSTQFIKDNCSPKAGLKI